MAIVGGARAPMQEYVGGWRDVSAIALGAHAARAARAHALGATGKRLLLAPILELRRRRAQCGLATACLGGGPGIAMIVRRES